MEEKETSSAKKHIHNLPRGTIEAMKELGPTFSISEFCIMVGIRNRMTVYRWIKEGKLKLGLDYFQLPSGHYRIHGLAIKRKLGIKDDAEISYRVYSDKRKKRSWNEGTNPPPAEGTADSETGNQG